MKIQKSTWLSIILFIVLFLLVTWCVSCRTIAYDLKTTNWKEPAESPPYYVQFDDELWYDCNYEHAKEFLYLWKEYEKWFYATHSVFEWRQIAFDEDFLWWIEKVYIPLFEEKDTTSSFKPGIHY